MQSDREATKGAIAAIAAFAVWGIVPIYWKAVGALPPQEMIAHRVLWAVPFAAVLVSWSRGWPEVLAVLRSRKLFCMCLVSAALIGTNWYVFIGAVAGDQVLESSLGYFINPLVNVVLGYVLLGERLRRPQTIAVALAGIGVLILIIDLGQPPWVALFLAFSFGLYGLVRKVMPINALPGLFLEALILMPLAAIWLGVMLQKNNAQIAHVDTGVVLLVPIAGLITAGPLWWFSYSARRLRLATLGLIQFLAPTGQFLLAVFLYGESFTPTHALTFGLIWLGLVLYIYDLGRVSRRAARPLR